MRLRPGILLFPLFGAAILLLTPPSAGGKVLYVSPDGSNAWYGGLSEPNAAATDGPKASLEGARDAVRAWRGDGPRSPRVADERSAALLAMSSLWCGPDP